MASKKLGSRLHHSQPIDKRGARILGVAREEAERLLAIEAGRGFDVWHIAYAALHWACAYRDA
ncbi:hypothetical protein [Paraburkholderia xenovorans]|uniref:hypothetical protein n=1 Tax=Paraburkholderia xenovorans TaxID=36873 RepID=UPI0038BB38C0